MSPLMRRRPLLRAAAVGGGGYAIGKRRAQAREQPEQPSEEREPEAAGGLSDATVARLQQLGQLHEQGVLTDDEFNAQKAKLLAG